MRPHNASAHPDHLHQEVWELLPWYANGTLERQELQQVERHLATCTVCQAELLRCRNMAAGVQAIVEVAWAPSADHFAQLMARIDAATTQPSWRKRWWQACCARYRDVCAVLQSTPLTIRWTLAAQGTLVLVLAGILVWRTLLPTGPYHTLSTASRPGLPTPMQLRVVFADDMTAHEIRTLLTHIGGTIVQGPSSVGAYTVAVSHPPSSSTEISAVLEVMRTHHKVRLAEPLSSH